MISSERFARIQQMKAEDIARSKELEEKIKSGEFVPPVPSAEDEMSWMRTIRDQKLVETDWTQGEDVPVGIKTAYKAYRQELRDIPSKYKIVSDVVWPTKPS
tara:strand:+ start:527 stop:832 length:306 start_codon:yes stop_codon:yes gene_type:complete